MKRLSGVRAATYDCWGTLLKDKDWEGAFALRAEALRAVADLDAPEARRLLDDAWAKHDDAWRQVETFGPGRMATHCLASLGIDDDDALAELTRRFEEASLETGVEAVPEAADTLATLRKAGFPLALVCDTGFTPGPIVRRMLDEAGLLGYLDHLFFSDEVGVPKPGNEIFAKALAALGVRPPEAVHVGDLKRTDIAGARDIGMRGVRFRGVHDDRTEARDADIVIDRHSQLVDMLGL